MSIRDRDSRGRPRNARPRDGLGRPLQRDARGVPRIDEDVVLTPAQALAHAQQLLDDGMPFHAHEVLEGAWKAAPDDERQLWRGLAQLAVGLTHLRRGNRSGGARLLERGRSNVSPFASDPPHRVDVTGLLSWAARVTASDETTLDPPTPRLVAPDPQ